MLRFLQVNLNHCRAAQDLLAQTVGELKIDVCILSEPHRREKHPSTSQYVTDSSGCAAVWICGGLNFQLDAVSKEDGFLRAKIGTHWIYSCYLAPSLSLQRFENTLDRMLTKQVVGKTFW